MARGQATRLLAGMAGAAIAIGIAAYFAFGWHWLHALDLLGHRQSKTTHLSVPSTFSRLTGLDPSAVRAAALILYAALFAYLLVRTWRGRDWLRNAAWASLALLLATAWLLPWYLILALPLVALSRDRPLQLLTLALTALPALRPRAAVAAFAHASQRRRASLRMVSGAPPGLWSGEGGGVP